MELPSHIFDTNISNLRHFLSVKQIYHKLIYPYISYAVLAWGNNYNSHLKKVQIKENLVGRLIFFVNTHGKDTESALQLLNLLDLFTVYNVYSLHALKLPISGIKVYYPTYFATPFFMLGMSITTILDMRLIKTYINLV